MHLPRALEPELRCSPDERKMLISEAADEESRVCVLCANACRTTSIPGLEELLSGHVSAIDQTASDIHDGGGHDGGGHAGASAK